jgi:pimeloyl-ACP methyl ester carboxylesterase
MVKAMRMRLLCFILIGAMYPLASQAQSSKVLPWSPTALTDGKVVYHPEPVLFVHGINADDQGSEQYQTWLGIPCTSIAVNNPGVLPQLEGLFQTYWVPPDARALIAADQASGRYRATQRNYLHTFNYGDPPGTNTHDHQTFDYIPWNVWGADRDGTAYTNTYLTPVTNQYAGDNRITLDERINGGGQEGTGIRDAYSPAAGASRPNIVMVAHSLGGLLSHYYMLMQPTNGVRRLVTLATPHLGSPLANWIWNFNVVSRASHVFRASVMAFTLQNVYLVTHHDPAGFSLYTDHGAVEDLMASYLPGISAQLSFTNALLTYLYSQQATNIEYVFNVYHNGCVEEQPEH